MISTLKDIYENINEDFMQEMQEAEQEVITTYVNLLTSIKENNYDY